MSLKIRRENPADVAAIDALTVAAFLDAPHASHTEHLIINALREAGQLSLSLVAEDDGAIKGHAVLSPVFISDGTPGWFGLGPVSVMPGYQGQGIGSQLVRQALDELRNLGTAGCVVLGDPAYYERFGFQRKSELVLAEVPPQYFQAVSFGDSSPAGTVLYHEVFNVRN